MSVTHLIDFLASNRRPQIIVIAIIQLKFGRRLRKRRRCDVVLELSHLERGIGGSVEKETVAAPG